MTQNPDLEKRNPVAGMSLRAPERCVAIPPKMRDCFVSLAETFSQIGVWTMTLAFPSLLLLCYIEVVRRA
jgi:hypothetical protein